MTTQEQVIALLSRRWWTVRDLALALGVCEVGTRWQVKQLARHRPVFARKATRSKSKRKPMAYRVYPEAHGVKAA